ncbi:ATP dependent DNA ligase [Aeoliella mucimassa]|uniref:DNA ligase (ATP) n=1 Tax=Aeoliella mucimassa TaxID=2527972 RepID=A0A518AQU1_9BACT|nr:hypothetical protein [Aeoliella mucimassa]QDU57073.1 hypothetical protein Pan181_32870 [Aeoliella mucimassa]
MSNLEDSNAGLLETPATGSLDPAYEGPRCKRCESPMDEEQPVCFECGYHTTLGITVEIDREWEAAANPDSAPAPQQQDTWQEITQSIPSWAATLAVPNVVIIAMSLAVRLLIPRESIILEFWGVWQLAIGLMATLVLHVTCFIMTASTDSDIGIFDLLVKPLKPWWRTFAHLPERLWLAIGGTCGVTLALSAVLIIGGIQWDRLWDWGIKAPAKQSLVSAIAAAAANGPANDDGLEQAVGDFAGGAAGGITGDEASGNDDELATPRLDADCLIVGFQLNDREEVAKLVLATEQYGKLTYAGSLTPTLEPDESRKLAKRLQKAITSQPILKLSQTATWVEPRFTCRVSYTKQSDSGRLINAEWKELLPEINMPW